MRPNREKNWGHERCFNLLGPLTNPAGVRNQIIGVFSDRWCEPVAIALGQLGARRAYVVHGTGGLDEIAVRGPTRMAEWNDASKTVSVREISPADFDLDETDPADLKGGDAAANAKIIRAVLDGHSGAPRNAAVMEAAVALVACDAAPDFRVAANLAQTAIDSGNAKQTLERWIALTRDSSHP